MFIFLFFFLLSSSFSADIISLKTIKNKYPHDFRAYQIEKDGTWLKKIADHNILFLATILGASAYFYYQNKRHLQLQDLPKLIIPFSGGFIGEKILSYVADSYKSNIENKKTSNYDKLVPIFDILEEEDNLEYQILIDTYYDRKQATVDYF